MPSKYSSRSRGVRVDRCRECGRHQDEAGPMSARDLCRDCGAERALMPAEQMTAKSGPAYDQWLRSMRAAMDRLATPS